MSDILRWRCLRWRGKSSGSPKSPSWCQLCAGAVVYFACALPEILTDYGWSVAGLRCLAELGFSPQRAFRICGSNSGYFKTDGAGDRGLRLSPSLELVCARYSAADARHGEAMSNVRALLLGPYWRTT